MAVTLLDGPAFLHINTLARLGQGETVGTLTTRRQRERDKKRKTKQNKTKNNQNNNFACASHLFVLFLPFLQDYDAKMPNFAFYHIWKT